MGERIHKAVRIASDGFLFLGIKVSPNNKTGENGQPGNATEYIEWKGVCGMDAREELFVKYFIKYGEEYPAAIEAGYKESTAKYAYEWLRETLQNSTVKRHLPFKPYLLAAIQEEMEKLKQPAIASAEEILTYLSSVMRKESEAEVLARDETGAERVIVKHPDEKEAMKAAELLGKRYNLWDKKQEADTEIPSDGFIEALRGEVAEVWQE